MKLFRFLVQKAKEVIARIQERERRIAKERAQREWGERVHRLMTRIQETCGPFTTEAELRGLPLEEQRPRMASDGTLRELLKRTANVRFSNIA